MVLRATMQSNDTVFGKWIELNSGSKVELREALDVNQALSRTYKNGLLDSWGKWNIQTVSISCVPKLKNSLTETRLRFGPSWKLSGTCKRELLIKPVNKPLAYCSRCCVPNHFATQSTSVCFIRNVVVCWKFNKFIPFYAVLKNHNLLVKLRAALRWSNREMRWHPINTMLTVWRFLLYRC